MTKMKIEGGKRMHGTDRDGFHKGLPVVSIITIVWNSKALIKHTIDNILLQSYPNIEYIIIDGASNDGTVEVIQSYNKQLSYWCSEKDGGLYDAMNKGIQAATGDYIWFINSGDSIYESTTLEKIISTCENADILYGDTMYTDDKFHDIGTRENFLPHKIPEQLSVKSLYYGMAVCHQSFIVKKSIAPLYDLQYRISADYNWQISCVKNAKKICNTHLILSRFLAGGLSRQHLKKGLQERAKVMMHQFGIVRTTLSHIHILVRGLWFFGVKRGGKI